VAVSFGVHKTTCALLKLQIKNLLGQSKMDLDKKFATLKAMAFAQENFIDVEGKIGTGRNGSFTIADLKIIQMNEKAPTLYSRWANDTMFVVRTD
jgi:hypothetical protein